MTDHDWKNDIIMRLKTYPDVKVESGVNFIHAIPSASDGFDIAIAKEANDLYLVHFQGWHEEFETLKDASECFAFGFQKSVD
jgi:hypothetical protein